VRAELYQCRASTRLLRYVNVSHLFGKRRIEESTSLHTRASMRRSSRHELGGEKIRRRAPPILQLTDHSDLRVIAPRYRRYRTDRTSHGLIGLRHHACEHVVVEPSRCCTALGGCIGQRSVICGPEDPVIEGCVKQVGERADERSISVSRMLRDGVAAEVVALQTWSRMARMSRPPCSDTAQGTSRDRPQSSSPAGRAGAPRARAAPRPGAGELLGSFHLRSGRSCRQRAPREPVLLER